MPVYKVPAPNLATERLISQLSREACLNLLWAESPEDTAWDLPLNFLRMTVMHHYRGGSISDKDVQEEA